MADELEANTELTYELIRDDGLRFTRQAWRMYQHIFNRTIRAYLETTEPPPWQDKGFRDYMLRVTRRIRTAVKDEVGDGNVGKPTFKRIAVDIMKNARAAVIVAQERKGAGAGDEVDLLGPVCSDYLANPDDPPPE